MHFNSWLFPVFFGVVYVAYLTLRRHRLQNSWLLLSSLVFYGLWDWRFIAPLLLSGTIDFYVARAMARRPDRRQRLPLLMISLIANLGFLAYFKYLGLFIETAAACAAFLGLDASFESLKTILPVGMSFYTFHALSYVIDVYRGEVAPTKRLDDFLLFLSYFPQLISGPIARARSLLPQLLRDRRTTAEDVDAAVPLILWGYFKKVVVADQLARIASSIFAHGQERIGLDVILALLAFTIQMYCDFSGFIDIARGCSRLMGIDLQPNFARPFLAQNPTDFWRRWNITLSQWLRDYLYIPLGGSKQGRLRTALNIMITMALSGLWHGAQWHMVVWGLYEGARQLLWRAARELFPSLAQTVGPVSWGKRILTFSSFAFGMIFFRCSSLREAAATIAALGLDAGPRTATLAATIAYFAWPVFVWDILEEFAGSSIKALSARSSARALAYGALLIALALFGARDTGPFVYYQF